MQKKVLPRLRVDHSSQPGVKATQRNYLRQTPSTITHKQHCTVTDCGDNRYSQHFGMEPHPDSLSVAVQGLGNEQCTRKYYRVVQVNRQGWGGLLAQ